VPDGFHITTDAYRHFVAANGIQSRLLSVLQRVEVARPETLERAERQIAALFAAGHVPPDVASAIELAYWALLNHEASVAVRSSATAEDLPEASFAGQQETYLNVSGAEAVLRAVQKCWASLWTARAIGYRARQGIGPEGVALAVVVQVLIPAEAAGILFTANPVTGLRDEVVINAAWGLGEAVVGGQVSPDSVRVAKASGKVLARETADKQVMTVRTPTGTTQQPVPEAQRRAPVLSDAVAAELARCGAQIEQLYGRPMDIEWALAAGQIAILQARPITALPEPELPTPTTWRLPKGAYAAMRNNIVELMGEPLSPLFATLGLSAVNASLGRVLTEALGMRRVMPDEIIIAVNHYAYYNGSLGPLGLARVLFGAPRIARQMFTGAVERWTEVGRPRYFQTIAPWPAMDWRSFSAVELLGAARLLTEAAIDAYTALLSGAIPAAWISEAVFTLAYNRLIKRRDDPPAPTYLLGYDSLPIRADKALYDLALWARQHPALRDFVDQTPTHELAALGNAPPAAMPPLVWQEWQERFGDYLRQFGHTLYDLDFAHPVPADDPAPVLDALKLYLRGQGVDPHARQQESAQRRDLAVEAMRQRLTGWRRRLFDRRLAAAQKYAPLREDGLAEIGLAYPYVRQALRELGRRLAQHGVIQAADDIFWLTQGEASKAAAALDAGDPVETLTGRLPQRRAEQRAARRASPPMALPQIKVFGFDLMSLKGRRRRGRQTDLLTGVAASPGQVTGVARVLRGPEDFGQMRPGDVLVASITTPAWTPLFAMASAVVTDIGGPLSHGSIVAREYGLPAVLGTGAATRRIQSGDTVLVDGTAGKVQVRARGGAGAAGVQWLLPSPQGVYFRGSVVDLMPDPLSPLFATMGLPAIVAGVGHAGSALTKSEAVLPDDYFLTINGYAYGGFNFTARVWWWIFARMVLAYPRLLRESMPHLRNVVRPRYLEVIGDWQAREPATLAMPQLWAGIEACLTATMDYVGMIMLATTGAAAGSEGLFTQLYERLARRQGDPEAATFLMGYDTIPVQAEKSLFDLSRWCRERPALAAYLLATSSEQAAAQLKAEQPAVSVTAAEWLALRERLERHNSQFGHLVFDLDFAKPLPRDLPALMIETIKMYLRDEGVDPHERQQNSQTRREQATHDLLRRLKGLKRWGIQKALAWAQSLAQVREDALADIGLGYPLLRRQLLELGHRFAGAGVLAQAGDIFWLERADVKATTGKLAAGQTAPSFMPTIRERQAFWTKMKGVVAPPVLPQGRKRILGIGVGAFVPASEADQAAGTLRGVPTSAGRVTARARVVHGPEDFAQMRRGEVLVAATTTPAWTPLFAMAAAVVTDIGGPLSHGSIVAREYGIPAVMGTGVATRRIQSGQFITVDGTAGTVALGERATA
jgi:pyruvate,water dikinase